MVDPKKPARLPKTIGERFSHGNPITVLALGERFSHGNPTTVLALSWSKPIATPYVRNT